MTEQVNNAELLEVSLTDWQILQFIKIVENRCFTWLNIIWWEYLIEIWFVAVIYDRKIMRCYKIGC